MTSQAKGYLRVPVWIDSGIVRPIADNAGRIPVSIDAVDVTLDVNLESSDISLSVTNEPFESPLYAREYGTFGTAWRRQPLQLGYREILHYRQDHELVSDTDWTLELCYPTGTDIFIFTNIIAYTDSGYCDRIIIYIQEDSDTYELYLQNEPAAYQTVGGCCNVVLRAPIRLKVDFLKPGIGAKVIACACGYYFTVFT